MADKTDTGKKRKRHTDGSNKPSKRVVIEEQQQVAISLKDAGEWAPIIASTPGLAVPSSLPLKPYTKPRVNAPQRPGRSGDIATKELLLHTSEHARLDYTAREEDDEGKDTLLKHYVGVYDPETGKLEVMEARKVIIRGSVRKHQATVDDVRSNNMREQRTLLGEAFGTKKAKKAILSVTENAISPDKALRNLGAGGVTKLDSNSAAILNSMSGAVSGMATREELSKTADAAKPRPKANVETTDIAKVYTIDELVGNDIMALVPVRNWVTAIKAKKEVFSNSRYVGSRLGKYGSSVEKLKLLRYMQLLIEFLNSCKTHREGRLLPKRDELKGILGGDIPEAVLEAAKRKFTSGTSMSKFNFDNLITHLCAISLVIENFEVDPTHLKEDLKMETSEICTYYKEVGAKISNYPEALRQKYKLDKAAAAQRKIVKLKLPLEFPKVNFGRRK